MNGQIEEIILNVLISTKALNSNSIKVYTPAMIQVLHQDNVLDFFVLYF